MKNHQSIIQNEIQKKILFAFIQPLTAKQISARTAIPAYTVSAVVVKFNLMGLVLCLNPRQRNSRVYRLTQCGIQLRKKICRDLKVAFTEYDQGGIDWNLYGSVCFNHRAAVIRTLSEPMQPSHIKRVLRMQKHKIRISANNIQNIIKFFLAHGIVRPVKLRGKAFTRYELTDIGTKFRQLLIKADMPALVKQ